MKLFTEKEIREAITQGYFWSRQKYTPSDNMIELFIRELPVVELPTDDEIELKSVEYSTDSETKEFYKYSCWDFQNGVKWVIDKIEGGSK